MDRDLFRDCLAEYRDGRLLSMEVFGGFTAKVGGVVFRSSGSLEEVGRKILLPLASILRTALNRP